MVCERVSYTNQDSWDGDNLLMEVDRADPGIYAWINRGLTRSFPGYKLKYFAVEYSVLARMAQVGDLTVVG